MPLLLFLTQAMDLYTAVMLRIFNDRAHQMSARMIKGDGHAYVPLETVAPVVEALLPTMDEVRAVHGPEYTGIERTANRRLH